MIVRLGVAIAAAALLFEAGCRTAPLAPPVPVPPPAPRPAFEKTFGDIGTDGSGLAFSYREMNLLVDPTPALLSERGATADFILYTRADAIRGPVRAGQKALGPDGGSGRASAAGLGTYKPITSGQRLMLSKNKAFAFVSAVRGRGPSGEPVNGYLLEFDNGRNIVILPTVADLAPVREFVYGLRDDGKSVYIGLFLGEKDAASAAEAAGLIQPQFAVFVGGASLDKTQMTDALTAQMFAGEWYAAPARDSLPF